MLDPLAGNVGRHEGAAAAASAKTAEAAGAFSRLTVQRGDPLSVLLSDLNDEASFIHAESLEDQAKKDKAGDIDDGEARRRLLLLERVQSVWNENDSEVSRDLDALRRARARGGREKFQELLREFGGGDASKEAALLAALAESDSAHREEYAADLDALLSGEARAVRAGANTLAESRARAREGGEELLSLQRCYQQALAAGQSVAQVLAATTAAFGTARFGAGCDFLSRAAAAELAAEARPLERAHLGELSARFKGLRVFQGVVARLEAAAERVANMSKKIQETMTTTPSLSPSSSTTNKTTTATPSLSSSLSTTTETITAPSLSSPSSLSSSPSQTSSGTITGGKTAAPSLSSSSSSSSPSSLSDTATGTITEGKTAAPSLSHSAVSSSPPGTITGAKTAAPSLSPSVISSSPSPASLTEKFFAALADPLKFNEAFAAPLESLPPAPRLRLLQEIRATVRELPDWTFTGEGERARLLQPIQDHIDFLVYEKGV